MLETTMWLKTHSAQFPIFSEATISQISLDSEIGQSPADPARSLPRPNAASRLGHPPQPPAMVSSEDIAEEIRSTLPGTEEIIVQYLSGYLLDLDDAAEDEDVLQVTRDILDSAIGSSSSQAKRGDLERLVTRLADLLKEPLTRREERNRAGKGTGLVRLDKVMDLSKANNMSNTIAFGEGVDLESINKGK